MVSLELMKLTQRHGGDRVQNTSVVGKKLEVCSCETWGPVQGLLHDLCRAVSSYVE